MFERLDVAISDKLVQRNVIAEGGEPEFGNTGGCGGDAFRERGVIVVFFEVDLLASLDLFGGGGSLAINDVVTALVEGFLQLKVLETNEISPRLIEKKGGVEIPARMSRLCRAKGIERKEKQW